MCATCSKVVSFGTGVDRSILPQRLRATATAQSWASEVSLPTAWPTDCLKVWKTAFCVARAPTLTTILIQWLKEWDGRPRPSFLFHQIWARRLFHLSRRAAHKAEAFAYALQKFCLGTVTTAGGVCLNLCNRTKVPKGRKRRENGDAKTIREDYHSIKLGRAGFGIFIAGHSDPRKRRH